MISSTIAPPLCSTEFNVKEVPNFTQRSGYFRPTQETPAGMSAGEKAEVGWA
jgi:hypothetical protein